ncbi:MAG TPA: hypothetical protein VNI77_01995 [Nitrososphaera sp.]|nr:hypothetical protein [Nitrososphaera sp.]
MRTEKEIRLRIDLLEGQSSSIAKILTKAIRDNNEKAFKEYAERLAANRGRVEELLWVLGERPSQSVLDMQVVGRGNLSVREAIEKLRSGEMKMDDLTSDAQAMIRKGALEMKNARKAS